jgi:hypothetical protein
VRDGAFRKSSGAAPANAEPPDARLQAFALLSASYAGLSMARAQAPAFASRKARLTSTRISAKLDVH